MSFLRFIWVLLIPLSIQAQAVSTVSLTHLTCNNIVNPVGIDSPQPHLSWQLNSGSRSVVQSAYRILVADNLNELNNNQGTEWDSKKVDSSQSIEMNYDGKALQPAKTYYWKVMSWDGDGKASAWSEAANWQTGLLTKTDWKNAKWIGYDELPDSMRMPSPTFDVEENLGTKGIKIPVVPLFRKDFSIEKKIISATLFITGLGQYEASINGKKIGNDFLTPGWTRYDKSIFYNAYDVTQNLHSGKNAIGVIVANGFYYIPRERYRKMSIAGGLPKMICRLKITYADGAEENVVSGTDWKTTPSPVTFSSIYGGEDYDARLDQKGWDNAGFNDSAWKQCILPDVPKGTLKNDPDFPVGVKDIIEVKKIEKRGQGKYLYDFGQNASGIVELKVKGKKGQQIKLIPGELLTSDHEVNQSSSGSPYFLNYTLKGDGVEVWKPRFTYYGFRYVMVEGAVPDSTIASTELPRIIEMNFLHTRNSSPKTGDFQCSNDLFNKIFTLINWAIKSNLQSVVTDCPHREKLGWLEQTYLMGNSIHYNFDIHELYANLVQDMMDSQLDNGLVPDIAPELVEFHNSFRDSPEWGSASVILPWLVYNWYGDKSVMEKAWPMMNKYVEYLKHKSDDNSLSGLGDWYDLGPADPGVSQLTPVDFPAMAIYYYDLKLLAQMATVLHKEEDVKRFTDWSEKVKTAFNTKFFNAKTNVYATGSQTSMSMPVSFGLVDEKNKDGVVKNLVDSITAHNKALTAGDVGFHYMVETLVENGQSQLLFDMNARNDVPGYGYQLKKGATALTESWMANEISSNNHLMLGHLMEWFYASLGGIQQEENSVAFKNIVIKPTVVGDITSASSSFETPYGTVETNWKLGKATFNLKVTIPCNTSALIYLPVVGKSSVSENNIPVHLSKKITQVQKGKDYLVYRVGSGKFDFTVK